MIIFIVAVMTISTRWQAGYDQYLSEGKVVSKVTVLISRVFQFQKICLLPCLPEVSFQSIKIDFDSIFRH